MIYTITLNPALDISGIVDEVIPNEKSYVDGEIYTPGGNGINAGIIASRLGAPVKLMGFLGGPYGKIVKDLITEEKIKNSFYPISNDTRMNITVSSRKTHLQTRLSFKGPEIKSHEWRDFSSSFEKMKLDRDIVIIGGSLPPGINASKITSFIRKLKKKGAFVMVDMPSIHLKEVIKARPDFIKPNLKEFQELTGSKANKIKSVLIEIRKLNKYVPLICVSSVEGGAVLANRQEACFGKTPKLKVRSTVGAGDSMVGAISTVILDADNSLDKLMRVGLAASCATLTEPGLRLGKASSIKQFLPQIKISPLN